MKNPRVLISIPCGDMMHSDFAQSLCYLLMHTMMAGIEFAISQTRTSVICASRNLMTHQALNAGIDFSHILYLDSDMIFPRNVIEHLLSHDVLIVGASYSTRVPPHILTHRDFDGTARLPLLGEHRRDIFKVASLGMGCVLVSVAAIREVLKVYSNEPLFKVDYRDSLHHTSEDVYFFRRCQQLSIPVYCDIALSHRVRHVGTRQYSTDDVQYVFGEKNEESVSVNLPFDTTPIEVDSDVKA